MSARERSDRAVPPPGGSRPLRENGRFHNPWPGGELRGLVDLLKWQVGRRIRQEIDRGPPWPPFERGQPAIATPRAAPDELVVTWIGHSTVLIQIGGTNILTDPIWSDRASPVRFVGPRRMVPAGVPIDALPPLDLFLLSHNHYDHFDDGTVRRLAARYPEAPWVVPEALGESVVARGAREVVELTWWESLAIGPLRIGAAPAQHFSARGLGDRGRSLWCSWSIAAAHRRVFFAGDTAYHPEFGVIGRHFGPFDLTLMPIGAYEPRWFMRAVHMNPEEAVRAHVELTAGASPGAMLPIHWGTFRLTDEPPGEPPERARRAWADAGLPGEALWLLRHGETRRARAPEATAR